MSPPSASNAPLTPSCAPDAAAVARFADDLARVLPATSAPLLVAVSGGPDSIALLLLAHRLLGSRCMAATVDHGLRPDAAGEAAWVAELCAALGVRHAVLTGALPERDGRTRNVSARARALRYNLLRAHADAIQAAAIATAHHADDQVETLVMRLNRGAGLAGLAGVRARGDRVIRPLLGWRRAELAAIVATSGIAPVDDPSNHDPRFDRARLRTAIGAAPWIEAAAWTRSARALADAETALEWTADRLWQERCEVTCGAVALSPAGLPFELQRRLVAHCVTAIDPDSEPRGSAVADAVTALSRGGSVMLGNVLCRGLRDARDEPVWRFAEAPPRRST
ncbi:tRNA lysidine(34) synthetase TilS [Sphingomonas sp. HHU CXW]|uniref:tRNA(Ile)-lysidine synthase n=1 Tax=Sphingomonas hominis TaxID=2741495 RepID=A0ABX2JG47_9SPHN|nr:tRNA lysidine(34) synthetase TilS [Sphingomonas hominis]